MAVNARECRIAVPYAGIRISVTMYLKSQEVSRGRVKTTRRRAVYFTILY